MSSTPAPELVLARDAGAITVTVPGHRLRLTAAEAATVLAELLADDHAACTIPLEPTGPVFPGSPAATAQPPAVSSSAAPRPAPRPTPPPAPAAPAAPAPVDAGAASSSASVYTTSTNGTPAPDLPLTAFDAFTEGGGDVYLIPTARDWVARLGATDDEIVETIENPVEEWLTDNAEVVCAVGVRIGVKVSTSDGAVLAICRARDMERFRPHRLATAVPRGRGGSGRRYPTDTAALLRLLDERGFTVATRGSGHYGVQPRGWPDDQFVTIPRTPSDSRSLINSIKQIERTFQVPLT